MTLCALWLAAAGVVRAEDTAPRLAVLELGGALEPQVLALLSDKVREGVLAGAQGQGLVVMTRENMAVIAKDMDIDLSCVEGECEVETARNLGASLVISGGVVKVDTVWIATLKLHETTQGGLLGTAEARSETPLGLVDQVAGVVQIMVRDKIAPAKRGDVAFGGDVQAVRKGTRTVLVRFESSPVGAVVHVDGQLECNRTPCTSEVPIGRRQVVFSMAQYRSDTQSIEVADNGQAVTGTLKARFAQVTVQSDRPVTFTVDGERSGTTNRTVRMPAGTHRVQVDDRCFAPKGVELTVSEGEQRVLKLAADKQMVPLEVRATGPDGSPVVADVYLDGQRVGTTIYSDMVWACHQRVTVRKQGLRESSSTISLKPEDNQVTLAMRSARPPPPRRSQATYRPASRRSSGRLAGSLVLTAVGLSGWGCAAVMYMDAAELHDHYEAAKTTKSAQARYAEANQRQLIGHGCMAVGTVPGLMGLGRLVQTSHTPMLRAGGRF